MFKKYKYFLLTCTLVTLFLTVGHSVLALEINYPSVLGFIVDSNTTISQYIQYVFVFLITTAGTVGIISIVISGFKILLSFGKPETVGAARENILSTVLGIILLASSVIILTTINPELVNIKTTVTPIQPGVYLRGPNPLGKDAAHPDGFEYIQAPNQVSNTTTIEAPYTDLYYYCAGKPGRDLLVWKFNQIGYAEDGTETTVAVKCDGLENIKGSTLSFSREYEDTGVYFYDTDDCTGFSSPVHKDSGEIIYPYVVQSVRIVNGPYYVGDRYGVILNKEGDGLESGECTEPIIGGEPGSLISGYAKIGDSGSFCYKVPKDLNKDTFNPFYVYIIRYDRGDPNLESGINLKSENLIARLKEGSDIKGKYLYKKYSDPESPNPVEDGNPDTIIKDKGYVYTDGSAKEECCTEENRNISSPSYNADCVNSLSNSTCLKDIVMNGTYYVVLYSQNAKSGERLCQAFTNDFNNIATRTNLLSDDRVLYKIAIIPRALD